MSKTRYRSKQIISDYSSQRNRGYLPDRVQQKVEHQLNNGFHFLPSSSRSFCSCASFLGVRCFVSTRLITKLSAEPPNKRSIISVMCCVVTWLRLTAGL